MEFLIEENLVGAKAVPTAVSMVFARLLRGNRVSLVRTFLSDPGSESKMSRLGVWGCKHVLDMRAFVSVKDTITASSSSSE